MSVVTFVSLGGELARESSNKQLSSRWESELQRGVDFIRSRSVGTECDTESCRQDAHLYLSIWKSWSCSTVSQFVSWCIRLLGRRLKVLSTLGGNKPPPRSENPSSKTCAMSKNDCPFTSRSNWRKGTETLSVALNPAKGVAWAISRKLWLPEIIQEWSNVRSSSQGLLNDRSECKKSLCKIFFTIFYAFGGSQSWAILVG